MFDLMKKSIRGIVKKIKVKELSNKDLDPIISELVNSMIRNEIAYDTAQAIGKGLKVEFFKLEHSRFKSAKPMIEEALALSVRNIIDIKKEVQLDLLAKIQEAKEEGRPAIILVLGINGTGKTTTIAKLSKLFLKNEYSVVVAASDTYRAGSIQQLKKHMDNLGIRVISQDYGSDPTSVAIDAIDHAEAKEIDVVIIDTAGRMQNNVNLVRELEKIARLTDPDVKIFIGDSLAGNDVIKQAKQFNQDIGIDGIIMTKLDSDNKGGAVISVAHTISKPILYLGVGQGYDDLVEFHPDYILKQVLP